MRQIRKFISILLVATLLSGCAVLPAVASEDPMHAKDYDAFGAAPDQVPENADDSGISAEETIPEEEAGVVQEPEAQEAAEEIPEQEPAEEIPEETEEQTEGEVTEETVPEETEPEEADPRVSTLKGMPLYFQTDYPDTLFADSTLAESGCSMTALAMVASYMTGYTYTPKDLARYFGGRSENNIGRLELGSETLGLPFRKAENWHKAREAIQQGKIAILLMNRKSWFTDSQHFLVVTGVNEDGKYLINDPYEPNYDHWKLKDCFINGFEEKDIILGYSGAWIYDKEAVAEDVPFYSEPDLDRSNPRYPDIHLTGEEKLLLARVVWVEARGESPEGQQAVAEVILNRLASDRFPDTLRNVIYSEGQFRSTEFLKDADPHQAQYDAIDRAIYGPYILPEDVYHFATFKTNEKVWGVIGGHIFCYAAE